jgi:hypothetical protein
LGLRYGLDDRFMWAGRDVGDQGREFIVVVAKKRRLREVVSLTKGRDE